MSDIEQQFSDLKQLSTKICKQAPVEPRVYADDAYVKKHHKRQADAAAFEAGAADSVQLKRHSVVQACTARNHDAAFLVATIASVEGPGSAILADPFYAPAIQARQSVERELARRRVAQVEVMLIKKNSTRDILTHYAQDVKRRLEEAVSRRLIEATVLASLKIDHEIQRVCAVWTCICFFF
jgi:hypothetical protein